MIVYFDTSALVKRYVAEADSPTVCRLWDSAVVAVSSWLLYPEMMAAFARKRREGVLPVADVITAESLFRREWPAMTHVALDDDLIHRLDTLHARHALRGADSVHLAAALKYRDLCGENLTFACADAALLAAARVEGLGIAPDQDPP